MFKKSVVMAIMVLATIGVATATLAEPGEASVQASESPARGSGWAAMERAAEEDKYLFVFFYKVEDEQTKSLRTVFDTALQKVADRADAIAINATDPAEKAIVAKFKVSRAPMPLVLALAPTGAVTGGFPGNFDEAQLLNTFVSPGAAKCLAALQAGKLVFLCLQNEGTTLNGEAMKGVQDFKGDEKYAKATDVIILDPGDPAEASFLKNLKVDLLGDEATTIFMAPPGSVLVQQKGPTGKDGFVKVLDAAMAKTGCGPGSAPGCCPPKKQGE